MNQKTATPKTAAPSAALQAVLNHQSAVSQAQQELERLQGLKTGYQDKIAAADRLDIELRQIYQQMQDLMADIEAGEDKRAELDELKKRANEKNLSLGDTGFDDAEDVLAGMDRKIGRALADMAALKAKRPALVRQLLMEEAEAMGAEYAEAALKTISLYHRLHAVNRFLMEQGQSVSICNQAALEVPCFELETVRPHATFHMRDYIKRGNELRMQTMHIDMAERQRFADMGVDVTPDGA